MSFFRKLQYPALAGAILSAQTGCQTTNDPTQGGLFGYWATGEAGYEARLAERRATLTRLESENLQLSSATYGLESQLASKESELDQLQAELDQLEAEVNQLASATKDLKRQKYTADLRLRIAQGRTKIAALRRDPNASPSEVAAEIANLKREVEKLRSL